MKKIAVMLKDEEFAEHIDDMKLALFKEGKLSEEEREEVFKHLSKCKRCRMVLKYATELEEKSKPVNNLDYKKIFQRVAVAASITMIFLFIPQLNKSNDATFKGAKKEQSILKEAVIYWENKIKSIFSNQQ